MNLLPITLTPPVTADEQERLSRWAELALQLHTVAKRNSAAAAARKPGELIALSSEDRNTIGAYLHALTLMTDERMKEMVRAQITRNLDEVSQHTAKLNTSLRDPNAPVLTHQEHQQDLELYDMSIAFYAAFLALENRMIKRPIKVE